jgi:hypothetical protein
MNSNVKHLKNIRYNFRYFLNSTGVNCTTVPCKRGIKDIYIYGNVKVVYVWHLTPSSPRVLDHKYSDMNRLAKRLGLLDQWKCYQNENTIHMQGVI